MSEHRPDEQKTRSITYALASSEVTDVPIPPSEPAVAPAPPVAGKLQRWLWLIIAALVLLMSVGAGLLVLFVPADQLPIIGAQGRGRVTSTLGPSVLLTAPTPPAPQPTREPTAAAFSQYYTATTSRPDRDPELAFGAYDQRLSVAYHSLQLNGQWEQAASEYRAIIADAAAPAAARREAYWRVAQCNFAGGSYDRAIEAYRQFQQQWPQDERSRRADYIIADAYNYLADYRAAIANWQVYLLQSGPLYSFTLLRIGGAQNAAGQYDAAQRSFGEVVNRAESSNRERVEALAGRATAAAAMHDYASELSAYEALLGMVEDKGYRADLEYRAAVALLNAANRTAAFDRFRRVVQDYAGSYRAYGAMQQMLQINANLFDQNILDRYTAGKLAYDVDSYQEAINYFAAYLNSNAAEHRAAALLYAGLSYQTLDNVTRARLNYQTLISEQPSDPLAVSAHYRLGQLAERQGACDAATTDYTAAAAYRDADDGRAAAFRLGLCRYKLGNYTGASDAWQPLTAKAMPADVRSKAYFWLARAATTGNDPTKLYQSAIEAQPGGYYAYRAAAKLNGEAAAGPLVSPARQDAVDYTSLVIDPTAEQAAQRELANWLRGWAGTSVSATLGISDVVSLGPAAGRVLAIAQRGERIYAKYELDYLLPRTTKDDALTLTQLMLALRYADEPYLALLVATRLAELSPDAVPQLPTLLRRCLFATPFADTVIAGASGADTSPLLFYALIKQESYYNPLARSGADARGLSQVLPATAAQIAANIGDSRFAAADLYRPSVAARYGALFLRDRLAEEGGSVLRALAAYNAGPGSLPAWSKGAAADDADLFVENISYAETAEYVRIVYRNYVAYLALYGQ